MIAQQALGLTEVEKQREDKNLWCQIGSCVGRLKREKDLTCQENLILDKSNQNNQNEIDVGKDLTSTTSDFKEKMERREGPDLLMLDEPGPPDGYLIFVIFFTQPQFEV